MSHVQFTCQEEGFIWLWVFVVFPRGFCLWSLLEPLGHGQLVMMASSKSYNNTPCPVARPKGNTIIGHAKNMLLFCRPFQFGLSGLLI